MKRIWVALGFISCVVGLQSQTPSWSTIKVPENAVFQQLQKDTLGFLWGLSKNGLFKYDGYQVSEKIIPDSVQRQFNALDLDQNNQLLVGCENGQVIRINPYDLSTELLPMTEIISPVTFMDCPNPDGNCVVISYGNHVLWKYDDLDTILSTANILVSNEVYTGVLDQHVLYLATDQGLQIIENRGDALESKVIKKEDGLSDIIVTHVYKNGNWIWMTDFDRSISKLNLKTGTIDNLLFESPSRINDLLFLQNGSAVVCRDDGAYFIEEKNIVKKYPIDKAQRVLSAIEDEESNIWFSAPGEGLVKGSLLFQKLDLTLNPIQALAYLDENFWIGNNEGLFIYDTKGQQKKLLDNNITSITPYNDLIWVGTYSKGVFVFDQSSLKLLGSINEWESHENQSVLYLLPEKNKIYISSLTGVISFKYNLSSTSEIQFFEPESYNDIIGPGYVYQIIQTNEKIYFATDRQGIKFIQNEELMHIDEFEDGSDMGSVYSMAVDRSGVLWFASSKNGLGYLNNGKAINRGAIKNPDDTYTGLANIANGNILLIRSGSIDILDPSQNHIMYYDSEVGISKEPPYLNTFSANDNDLWFAHDNKLYRYQAPHNLKIHPEIQIDQVLVNLADAKGRNSFRQDENNIQFQYTGSWLTNPEKLSYQYQLEGIDDEWRNTLDRTVSYPKLNPGNYTFKVRASENAQYAHEPEQHFKFRINKFFYNTVLFWSFILLIGVVLLFELLSSRKRRQLKQSEIERKHVESQLLNLKSQLNPHFLFNSFNTLVGLIEEDTDRSIVFTEKLTDFYRLVLEHGKNQLVHFNEEFRLIQLYVDVLNERFNNAIEINLSSGNIQSLIPPLTLQLLVENAIKHNEVRPSKKLSIAISKRENYISVINKKYPKPFLEPSSGSGLDNIKKRYKLLDANSISILDSEEAFEVRLPIIPLKEKSKGDSAD